MACSERQHVVTDRSRRPMRVGGDHRIADRRRPRLPREAAKDEYRRAQINQSPCRRRAGSSVLREIWLASSSVTSFAIVVDLAEGGVDILIRLRDSRSSTGLPSWLIDGKRYESSKKGQRLACLLSHAVSERVGATNERRRVMPMMQPTKISITRCNAEIQATAWLAGLMSTIAAVIGATRKACTARMPACREPRWIRLSARPCRASSTALSERPKIQPMRRRSCR